jgi:hypothetical protein
MAHFAELDENNVVVRVVVVSNDAVVDEDGVEQESIGVAFCQELFGGGNWVQTSYNNNFRRMFAGVGSVYRGDRNAFQPVQKFASWTFNDDAWEWEPPVPWPASGGPYRWNEELQQWDDVSN